VSDRAPRGWFAAQERDRFHVKMGVLAMQFRAHRHPGAREDGTLGVEPDRGEPQAPAIAVVES